MISRTLEDIFLQSYDNDGETELNVAVSFIEIYNEKVYDMLSLNYSEPINLKGLHYQLLAYKRKINILL